MADNKLYDSFPEDISNGGKFTIQVLANAVEEINILHLKEALTRMPGSIKKSNKKKDLANMLASGLMNKKLLALYLSSYSEKELSFLMECIFNWGKTGNEILRDCDISFEDYVATPQYMYMSATLDTAKAPFIGIINYKMDYSRLSFSIHPVIKSYLSHVLAAYYKKTQSIESNISRKFKKGYVQNIELFEKSPVIMIALRNAGLEKRNASDKILKGAKKALRSVASIVPFASETELKKAGYDEKEASAIMELPEDLFIRFFAGAFSKEDDAFPSFSSIPNDPLSLYRKAMENYFSNKTSLFDFNTFAPAIRPCYGYSTINHIRYRLERLGKLKELLTSWAKGTLSLNNPIAWNTAIDFKNFLNFLPMLEGITVDNLNLPPLDYAHYEPYYINKKWNQVSYFNTIRENLFAPFYTNLFLTFAALGLFEVECTQLLQNEEYRQARNDMLKAKYDYFEDGDTDEIIDYKNKCLSYPYGMISVIRMTELGRAVFDQDYELKGSSSANKLAAPELKPSFIISLDKNDAVSAEILKPYCRPISPWLLKTGLNELLEYCHTKESLENFFTTIKNLTKKKLPPEWEELKKKAESRFVKLKPKTNFVVFSLEDKPREFILAIDTICRRKSYAFHMDDMQVAVKQENLRQFTSELVSEGFVLNIENS
ncbi:MAG: hypothetical protein IJU95_09050 [Treponema sp.]|nr:hypothetical protein [Treponema sp.]